MMRRLVIGLLALIYLAAMAYFAFRPFRPIRGIQYAPAELEWVDGAIHLQTDAALEVDRSMAEVREALTTAGEISLELVLRPDRLEQPWGPFIVAYGQSSLNQNFSVAQVNRSMELRLLTTSGWYDLCATIEAPEVFGPDGMPHVVITYDGAFTRFYVDGRLHAESEALEGGFQNWGHNHVLTLGDEPPGGGAWHGCLRRFSLYDRSLSSNEVATLYSGEALSDSLLFFDFEAHDGQVPDGLKKLRYRNLFVTTDAAAYDLPDCIFNVIGFIPLGALVYMVLPLRLERRKIIAALALPLLAGLVASGTIELLQCYVFMRVPCVPDLVYNSTGSLMGGLLAWLAFSTFKNKESDGSNI